MKKMINKTHIEGLLYDKSKLELKVSGPTSKTPGTEFISGEISIATDNACTNIVPVHFTYVTATTGKGKANATFTVLKNIIDGVHGSVMGNGKENATKLRIDSAIGVNDFYVERDGKEELVSAKRNEGGFVHLCDVLDEHEDARDTFEADIVITNVREVEADTEKGYPAKAIVRGAIFDFRNALLPVEFTAVNPNAMNYFLGLEASSKKPVFTKVWGRQVSTVSVKTIEEESAFGDTKVREVQSTRRDWVITGASKDPYVWDDEESITAEEMTQAMADREVYLADVKRRNDEYKASKATPAAKAQGDFKF